MDRHHHKILLLLLIVSILLVIAPRSVFAGELDTLQVTVNHDAKSIELESETPLDTLQKTVLQNTPKKKPVRDWATWHPNPKRALWLALVLPGAGQIYNRKYWKLPLVYGGFVGCVYAMRWNDQMYHDYSQAYLDISDDDPNTQSYNQFLHLGKAITKENMATYQNLFKQRKDRYRRWRDLSFFCLLGVYALSVIDAYVDASLSEFDISNNLSLRVEPAIINNRISRNPFTASAVGLQCSLNF
ncbi:DUF5683 domain-containing protein [Hoylesella pleuritidis]|uniref:DUF5683 domain-containing protein n=1 Tax=Hoylesella pleuritidis TaxID=407975 RepID=UPI0028E9E76A|nr:DUF5683 domain-containing protein [Hoylesella pleuritidis]